MIIIILLLYSAHAQVIANVVCTTFTCCFEYSSGSIYEVLHSLERNDTCLEWKEEEEDLLDKTKKVGEAVWRRFRFKRRGLMYTFINKM